jgi:hypothetical protein
LHGAGSQVVVEMLEGLAVAAAREMVELQAKAVSRKRRV